MIKHFIDNRDVNLFNIHAALIRTANGAGHLFGPIYLYQNGFTLWQVFLIFGLTHLARVPFRFVAGQMMNLWGIKWTMFIGGIGMGIAYYFISYIEGMNLWFWVYVGFFIVFQPIFWVCNHLMYSLIGDAGKRGRQTAALKTMQIVMDALFPLVSALIITAYSYHTFYLGIFGLILVSYIPIFFTGAMPMPRLSLKDDKKASLKNGFPWYFYSSFRHVFFFMVWMFVILVSTQENLILTGGYLTIGVIAQILWQLLLGHSVDNGKGQKLSRTTFLYYFFGSLGKALLPINAITITANEVFGGVARLYSGIVMNVAVYNSAQEDRSPYWFWIGAEGGWDIGKFIACCIIAVALYFSVPIQYLVICAIPGSAMLWYMMHQHYHDPSDK